MNTSEKWWLYALRALGILIIAIGLLGLIFDWPNPFGTH